VAILDLVKATRIMTAQALSYSLRDDIGLERKVTKLSRAFGELGVSHDHATRDRTQLRTAVGARLGG